ncbi:YjbH domain-containing protein [Amylibacter sp. IMCC11727]|uniref:YjbH domain-containing protein n=1 Tax=Amylibacter sp. IMCC11727 TaxID=3039851 RepID=UPI00244E5061|nr:YjbH domain-containing protein [Amylibacter sp. IMCC11727]WGI21018.1 YjbH domain-containing protein [Amylibacter sp. IMCC11727]
MAKYFVTAALLATTTAAFSTGASAQSLNLYGNSGLIDMPSADPQPDAQISGTIAGSASDRKITLSFQLTKRLSASFRYSDLKDWTIAGDDNDRSFDVQFQLFEETDTLPGVAIGLRDFMGQGAYGAEYLVATKTVHPKLKLTGGFGWGRLGNSSNIADLRVGANAQGGVPTVKQWFDGPVGFFGGAEWQTPVKGLTFKAEYSSDKYAREVAAGAIERKSPFNFGLEYKRRDAISFGLYYLHGSEVGLRFSAAINPKRPPTAGSLERAPLPVIARPVNYSTNTDWANQPNFTTTAREKFAAVLKEQGLAVEALAVNGRSAELRIRNDKFNASSQAIGRAARAMSFVLPHSVEEFVITPVVDGIPASSVVIRRSDLERLENDPMGTEKMLAAANIRSAFALPEGGEYQPGLYPNFSWTIAPYVSISLFDGSGPVRASAGLRASADYAIAPGFSLSGAVTQRVFGNQVDETPPPSGLPRVRTDRALYKREGKTALERLTADYLFKPAPDFYGRVSVGYLESMFGGVSTELLWQPANQRWGLGVDLNYVKQRDFDQLLGFQDYDTVTGHVSAYWAVNRGLTAQLDVGRYLAGDWGATLSVDRVFANGWRMGAYATVTDADPSAFGDGSFTKGLRLSVPLSWGIGTPTRKTYAIDMNTEARDGGARLNVEKRLYGLVSEYQRPGLEANWARFWR